MVDVEVPIHRQSVGIIGAGAAGLITGYTLLQDGFQNIQLLTRDKTVGGIWAKERIYPGIALNNVHGEFKFTPLPMPSPTYKQQTGNRLSGEDMSAYMERFTDKFLSGRIRFETEVLDVRRGECGLGWDVEVLNLKTGDRELLSYVRIVLCTGGCSQAHIPEFFSTEAAMRAGFRGPVVHTSKFASHVDQILREAQKTPEYSVVIVGGGKSAQDAAAHLARHGVKVTVVFEKAEGILAYPVQLPECFRKSRLLSVLSPHIELRTRLEWVIPSNPERPNLLYLIRRFLHTTVLGSMITHGFWNLLLWCSLEALQIPKDSPLRNTHLLFWGVRTTDVGTWRKNGFHAFVNQGRIQLAAPKKARGFALDGKSVLLSDGQTVHADAVILATGYSSSWTHIFTAKTADELGIARRPTSEDVNADEWAHYTTLASPPTTPRSDASSASIYRGIVPAKNICKRDFAINGAVFTTNNGYSFEVMAHWISSYFVGDDMRLPSTPEQALTEAARTAAWTRKRFPEMVSLINESYSSEIPFWSWPQAIDDLLDDMGVPSMRSGGNWLTWPFQVISVDEIATLGEERRARRMSRNAR